MRRNPSKYFKIALSTYLLGALFICRGAKNSYFFCRAIDDLADGDVKATSFGYENFQQIIQKLREVVSLKAEPKTALEILGHASAKHNNGEIREFLLRFLDAMWIEYKRRKNKTLNSSIVLAKIHQNSFDPVLRIAFVAFNTNYSDYIIESLTAIQSKVYSIQDLEQDVQSGIYNFPAEIYETAPVSHQELINHTQFREWINDELMEAKRLSEELLKHKYPKKTQRVINTLVLPVLEDIDTLKSEYHF